MNDEPYYFWCIGSEPWSRDFESLYVYPSSKPSRPPAQLAIALPFHDSQNDTFEGLDTITLTGTVRRSSGTIEGIQGHIGAVLARPGYALRAYVQVFVGPYGTYSARVPVASSYVAGLWSPATDEQFPEILWTASGSGDHEAHDIDLP